MTGVAIEKLAAGDEVGRRTITVTRDSLVRYAGASGDFNPIHYNDRFATAVGLPGVIAHGMFTMGAVVAVVADWVGDPGRIVDYVVRFSRPVPVPDPGAAAIDVVATVAAVNAEAGTVRVNIAATVDGAKVLGKAQATVRI